MRARRDEDRARVDGMLQQIRDARRSLATSVAALSGVLSDPAQAAQPQPSAPPAPGGGDDVSSQVSSGDSHYSDDFEDWAEDNGLLAEDNEESPSHRGGSGGPIDISTTVTVVADAILVRETSRRPRNRRKVDTADAILRDVLAKLQNSATVSATASRAPAVAQLVLAAASCPNAPTPMRVVRSATGFGAAPRLTVVFAMGHPTDGTE